MNNGRIEAGHIPLIRKELVEAEPVPRNLRQEDNDLLALHRRAVRIFDVFVALSGEDTKTEVKFDSGGDDTTTADDGHATADITTEPRFGIDVRIDGNSTDGTLYIDRTEGYLADLEDEANPHGWKDTDYIAFYLRRSWEEPNFIAEPLFEIDKEIDADGKAKIDNGTFYGEKESSDVIPARIYEVHTLFTAIERSLGIVSLS
ncbi:MAG TPA: hypothetical protein VLF87_03005 [Patescibacteria group bacterium]|nr:hypothetical protein [Patescibacteria group bacterium]